MGGCRCSYKNCERATKNSEKDFHFFHYPVRDPERCLKWIANACKPTFYNLPEDQLRNKVICQNHFELHYFTNANRKRLIHNAVPTLNADCLDGKDASMCNVQVLQSDSDASVFTVDTNLLNMNEVSEVRSFIIENGDIVPADITQQAEMEHEPQIIPEIEKVSSYITVNENNINNDCKIEDVSENVQRNDVCIKSEPDCIKEGDICNGSIVNSNSLRNGEVPLSTESIVTIITEKKMAKVKSPFLKNRTTEFENLSKAVEEHTKEIATLKRLLNSRIQKVKLKKRKHKMQVLGKLRTLLPPTLLALVNLHLFGKQDNFTKEEKHLLTTLFKASPSAYEVLLNDCKWKLPSATVVKNLTCNGNGVR
ncbi:hypothetical protein RN001_016353 [Aquatica leii]|uniref:THAP-type domain-containing protein n=1 Tax=Aquatica leii TaxID=1421715 RepID=A0AAN7NXT7_9COLE|nr:hypothetical protein RN001_016353 [Aquatica leii]